jgi:hypothetical protein
MASGKKVATRLSTKHSVFGQPKQLSSSHLPNKDEVFRCYLWHRNNLIERGEKSASTKQIVKLVADDVISIWNKGSIPVIAYRSVLSALEKLIEKGKDLQKYQTDKRSSSSFQDDENRFRELFDICPCKCLSQGIIARDQCRCAIKVPVVEWDFWRDQKSDRKMVIGPVDEEITAVLQQRCERLERQERYKQCMLQQASTSRTGVKQDSSSTSSDSGPESSGGGDEISLDSTGNTSSDSDCENSSYGQNRRKYPNLCEIMERSGLSNRDACNIINACLQDMGLDQSENLLEASKLRRQRTYWRKKEVVEHLQILQRLLCIGFDGRIDETRVLKGDSVARTRKEDHYVIVAFPQQQYVDHVSPQSGASSDISVELLSVINHTQSTESLCAVTCDSTNVNTGEHNGVIRRIELSLNRPLQWLVCMLHLNELPFREVFKVIDGDTSGPKGLKGPVGSHLDFDPCQLPIVPFVGITGNVNDVDETVMNDLSQDQKYLLRACLAVQSGQQDAKSTDLEFLETASPGALCHARWLTRANRTLRLYMGTEQPSLELQKLVSFIIVVYAPTWFQIKSHPRACDGAINFFFLLRTCRELNDDQMRDCVTKVLSRNSYFAHPENILITAVDDSDYVVRRDAVDKIVCARQNVDANKDIRKFSKSSINLNLAANSYYDLIDWTCSPITPPPLLSSLSDDELSAAAELGPIPMPRLPCHTQAVERSVKDVTRVSTKVFGHESRHGMLVLAEKSRSKRPKLETKHSLTD